MKIEHAHARIYYTLYNKAGCCLGLGERTAKRKTKNPQQNKKAAASSEQAARSSVVVLGTRVVGCVVDGDGGCTLHGGYCNRSGMCALQQAGGAVFTLAAERASIVSLSLAAVIWLG